MVGSALIAMRIVPAVSGAGSIAGMVGCSLAIALPLRWAPPRLATALRGLEGFLGAGAIVLGSWIVVGAMR